MTRYPQGIGTSIGIVVIFLGLIYAIWQTAEINEYAPVTYALGREYAARQFIETALHWFQKGMLLIMVAEVGRRLVRL